MTETAAPAGQFTDGYDEAFEAPGVPRPHYAELLGALEGTDLAALRDAVNARVADRGVVFRSKQGENAFLVDPIPRIIPAEEWALLSAGLRQRVEALNAFVHDAYGERRIVEAGVMPARAIDSAEGYEPDLRGALPPGIPPVGIGGLDIVRDRNGELRVLEDNLRTPSGITYADAAREAVAAGAARRRSRPTSRCAPRCCGCSATSCARRRRRASTTRSSWCSATARAARRGSSTRRSLGCSASRPSSSTTSSTTRTASSTATRTAACAPSTSSTGARTRIACATTTTA